MKSNQIKIKLLYSLLYILLQTSFCNILFGQTYFDINSQAISLRNDINIDSIFTNYESPEFPDKYLSPDDFCCTLYIGAYVSVDTNLMVSKIQLYPFYGIGNDLPKDHELWKLIENRIEEASAKWSFKPVLWKSNINGIDAHDKTVNEYNKNKKLLPRGGTQEHFIIFHFGNIHNDNGFEFLYQIRAD